MISVNVKGGELSQAEINAYIVHGQKEFPEKTISATAQEETMHAAIDAAVAKIQRMLVKENAKQKEFRAVPLADAVN